MTNADYLSRQLATMSPHRAILRAVECRLMSQVQFAPPVLDIGSGDGHFASIAYDRPVDLGIDVAERDLREAKARRGVYRSVALASASALPIADGVFGTVVSNCVVEHIPDLEGALREIARVLRPGGCFATTLPSEHFGAYLLGARLLGRRYADFFNRISRHRHVYPPEVWCDKLAAVGLRLVEHRYYFSAEAHRAFDLSHYLSVPYLITRLLTGKWVVHPLQSALFERWLRRYYEEPSLESGAYQFLRCEKVRE